MLEDSTTIAAMGRALATLLRPIVRFLLKHSFPYSAFEAIAKRVYAETAMTDFALLGRKPSVSRASILTGLTRKDVHALLQAPWTGIDPTSTHYNRAARVVAAWVRDRRFHGTDGAPRPLTTDGPDGFAELVRLHGGDVPVRAVLDELMRVGAVRAMDDGRVALMQRGFVPSENMLLKLAILGTDVGELVETITHNLDPAAGEPRFQRKVMHIGVPVEQLPAFRDLSSRRAQSLLEALDAWLATHDMGGVPESTWPPGGTAQVGIGIYCFEQVSSDRPAP